MGAMVGALLKKLRFPSDFLSRISTESLCGGVWADAIASRLTPTGTAVGQLRWSCRLFCGLGLGLGLCRGRG